MFIKILKSDVIDLIKTISLISGPGFSYIYDDSNEELKLDGSFSIEQQDKISDWKNQSEYIIIKREQKLHNKYIKELNKSIWEEVKKNKDADLDIDDISEVDKKIQEL